MGISRRPAKYGGNKRERKSTSKGADKKKASASRAGKMEKRVQRDGFVLTVVDGQLSGKEYFFETLATVGRVDENDIAVMDPGMSRNHARVHGENGVFMLEDLGSANGTRLNGEKVEPNSLEPLRDGDYITFGTTTMQFSVLESARGEVTAETRLDTGALERVDHTKEGEVDGKRGFFRRPLGKVVIVLVVLLVGGGLALKLLRKKGPRGSSDNSDVPVTYSDDDKFFNRVFGLGKYDRSHPRHVVIHFEYLGGRAELQYGAWGIDKVGEVEVRLNGKKIGKVPLTRRWQYGLKMLLPRDKLRKDKTNELIFDNKRNPPNRDPWGICYVQVHQEAIPPPDVKVARHRFELAKKAWEDREVEPGNMYDALVGFKKARNYLEGSPTARSSAFYREVVDYLNRVDKALTKRFQEGTFSARRAEKVRGNRKAARQVLLRAMRFFHKDDFRYRELKRYLDRLSGRR